MAEKRCNFCLTTTNDSTYRGNGCVLMALEQLTVMWHISGEVCAGGECEWMMEDEIQI